MEGLLKFNYADADATGVAHDNIDEILADNKAKTAFDIGSIGPTPFMETDEGQQTLMDIAMESAFPGAAIGRMSKAAVTGGSSIFPKLTQNAKWLQLKEVPKKYREVIRGIPKEKFPDYFKKPSLEWHDQQNKINAARMRMEKALDKHKIPHQRGIPSQPEKPLPLMDSVSELLHALRFRKN